MKIKYLGHSCFALKSDGGVTVVCDPYDPSVGFAMPCVRADIVTLSHHHYDHCYVQGVAGNFTVWDKAASTSLSGVDITAVSSFHDDVHGAARGENVIYKFCIDGVTVCHMGDLGERFSPGLVQRIGAVNVLLIPVGGTYTVDAATAKEYADAINPDVIIPMHYRTKDCNLDISGAEAFLQLYDGVTTIEKVAGEIALSSADMRGLSTKIIVMEKE